MAAPVRADIRDRLKSMWYPMVNLVFIVLLYPMNG